MSDEPVEEDGSAEQGSPEEEATGSEEKAGGLALVLSKIHGAENTMNLVFLVVMALIPIVEMILRPLGLSIPGAIQYVSVLTLWIGFTGAMLAARDNRHLSPLDSSVPSRGQTGRRTQCPDTCPWRR